MFYYTAISFCEMQCVHCIFCELNAIISSKLLNIILYYEDYFGNVL